jgi:hypothetical protein
MLLAIDRDDDLVEMPLVAQTQSAAVDFVGEVPAEFPALGRSDDFCTGGILAGGFP